MDAAWLSTSSAPADDQEEAYDAWASALSNTSTSAPSSATPAANTNTGVSNMLEADMPLSSNLDHVFGHITYAQRSSPATTPATEAPVPILESAEPEQEEGPARPAAPRSEVSAEADSATFQVSEPVVSSGIDATSTAIADPVPGSGDVLDAEETETRRREDHGEPSSIRDPTIGSEVAHEAVTVSAPVESQAQADQESKEVVDTILGEDLGHPLEREDFSTTQAGYPVPADESASLDWMQEGGTATVGYQPPSADTAVEAFESNEARFEQDQHVEEAAFEQSGAGGFVAVDGESHATHDHEDVAPIPSFHVGTPQQDIDEPSRERASAALAPSAAEVGTIDADHDSTKGMTTALESNTTRAVQPFPQESVEPASEPDFFTLLDQENAAAGNDWLNGATDQPASGIDMTSGDFLQQPNDFEETSAARGAQTNGNESLESAEAIQEESVDTDWLKGEAEASVEESANTDWLKGETEAPVEESANTDWLKGGAEASVEESGNTDWLKGEAPAPQASVEDSWAQALGDPDKLDDAWGAALDDDDGFLEDEPIIPVPPAPAPAQATPAAPAARSTTQYAPTIVTNTAIPAQPPSAFTPVASPFAAYTAPPAVTPPVQKKEPTAAPMQFFEDLPTTRPAPARRPKPQAMPSNLSAAPPPPSGSAPPASLGRPMPPPRTSSSMYSQQPQFQAPEKLDLFPPQSQGLPPTTASSQPPMPPSMSAPPVNNRYSPALRDNVSVQSSKPPTPSVSRYAAAQPQPSERPQSSYAPQVAPLPPQPQSQLPTTPMMPEQSSFIPSPPNAAQNTSSRYSPASAAGPAPVPAATGATFAVPSRPTNRFVPRTSSPLVHGSLSAQAGMTTTSNSYAPASASQPPPPAPSQRYGPPSSSLRPAPRTLERSVSFAAQPPPQQQLQDGIMFTAPQRPRTSSPVHTRSRPQVGTSDFDRPATSNLAVSPNAVYHAPSSAEHDMQDFVLPDNETALDQLQRWRGTSIFRWGAGGLVVSTIPKHIPRYGGGQSAPKLKPVSGEVKLRKVKDIIQDDDGISTFPGPLRAKGKKKDVLTWLSARIATLEQNITSSTGSIRNAEEKVLLWKVLRLMVENDGQLTGSADAVKAVQEILKAGLDQFTAAEPLTAPVPEESHSPDPAIVPQIRAHLLAGEREKAIWHAVDHRRWGHAFILASTAENKVWKQVVQEFVRKQVRSTNSDNRSLATLYEVFAGNWDDSVDQLVPLSARQGFQMVSTAQQSGQSADSTEGLEKWRETLSLIINNRSNGDENALIALGKLLAKYGRIEAAHVCFLFARNVVVFGGADDTQSHFTLLGVDLVSESSPKVIDSDAILLSEVYEFALSLAPSAPAFFPPHLQAYKLQHAYQLAELGMRNEAQQYCDAISSATKSSTKGSTYYHTLLLAGVEDLSKRLSQSPQTPGSGWMGNLSAGKVSGSVWTKFNKFVVGEETDSTASGTAGAAEEAGPFGRITSGTPTISRTPSVADLSGYGNDMYRVPSNLGGGGGGRYAPSSISASPDQTRLNPYAAAFGTSPDTLQRPFERRISSDSAPPTSFGSPPRAPMFQRQTSTLSRYASNDGSMNLQQSAPYEPQPFVQSVPEDVAVEYSSYPSSRRTSTMAAQPNNAYQPSAPSTPSFDEPEVLPPAVSNRYSISPAASERSRPSSARYEASAPVGTSDNQGYTPSASYTPSVMSESAPAYGGYNQSPTLHTIPSEPDPVDYEPTAPMDQLVATGKENLEANGYSPYSYQAPAASVEDVAGAAPEASDEVAISGYQPSSDGYAPPIGGYQPMGGYEPPSGGYVPYDPGAEAEPVAEDTAAEDAPKPKRRGIMDLDDDADEPYLRPSADDLKRQEKAQKDRENEELIRKAAEADAQRDADAKAAKKSGGWFGGGWFGGKKDAGPAAPVVHKGKLGEKLSLYYDPETKKWVNPNATEEEKAASAAKATPPPPRAGPPMGGAASGPPMGAAKMPPAAFPPTPGMGASPVPSLPGSGPPTRPGSAAVGMPLPPSAPGSAPPSRPPTSASGAGGVATLDDLLGGPPGPRAGGAARKKGKGSRYVDVMAK